MGECGNWAGATKASFTAASEEPNSIIQATVTVPEDAGSHRRRGSTDFIRHFHLLAEAAGASSFSSPAASAML